MDKMKNRIITLILLHLFIAGTSQDPGFAVQGTYSRTITKDEVNKARTLVDINPGYPSSWIHDYLSAEILVSYNGSITKGVNVNDTLNKEQRSVLTAAGIGSDIVMDVKYKKRNVVTDMIDFDTMIYTVRVVPEIEAEFPGGYQQMVEYLEKSALRTISESGGKQLQLAVVKFTVNEEGRIHNVQISKSSDDEDTDRLLLESIHNMPKWRPAENGSGMPVKQEFEFRIGNAVGC